MVNIVPSYCVSLDILLSECSFPSVSPSRPNSPEDCKNMNKKSNRTRSNIFSELENLAVTKEECTGQPVKQVLKVGEYTSPPRRWIVLAIFCAVFFMQAVVWNTWSPIAAAVLYAFPSWNNGSVALFSNWGSLCSVIFIAPACWLLNEKGLKVGCVIGSCFCTIGTGIRCLTMNEIWFTYCAHIGAFLNAIAGVIFGPSVVLLSSSWFPVNQRASATGAGTAMAALGVAGSYLLGPLLISLPVPDYPDKYYRYRLRQEIKMLMILDFAIHFLLLIIIIICFPANPPAPPSHSSCLSLGYKKSFKKSVQEKINIWLLGFAAAFCSGMTGPWISQLTILFSQYGFTAVETTRLGFWTIISSCCLSITVSRFSDLFQGHIKGILIGLSGFATLMFIWICSLMNNPPLVNKHSIIIAVICGFSASFACSPLFFELGAELAYPVSEGIVAGYIMSMTSISSVLVYGFLYLFTETALNLMNYGLVIYNILAFIILIFVEDQYYRLAVDENS
ncbi:solute carrier family 49 member 4 homolog [Lycorma delicatula]|uniref:solute carrier family 49 member 4 homolog n=1 Tax=Lycorma delicatula TaxID=130591 RepID=UPI003F5162DF